MEGLVYFDLQLIEPMTKFILTEQIRQLRSVAYTRPFEFPRRIFILDEAQAIHWQAVDLLLEGAGGAAGDDELHPDLPECL